MILQLYFFNADLSTLYQEYCHLLCLCSSPFFPSFFYSSSFFPSSFIPLPILFPRYLLPFFLFCSFLFFLFSLFLSLFSFLSIAPIFSSFLLHYVALSFLANTSYPLFLTHILFLSLIKMGCEWKNECKQSNTHNPFRCKLSPQESRTLTLVTSIFILLGNVKQEKTAEIFER